MWSWVSTIPPSPPRSSSAVVKRSQMSRQRGTRIDHPSRIASHHPAVGARHRERTRVLGTQAQDAETLQSLAPQMGRAHHDATLAELGPPGNRCNRYLGVRSLFRE